MQMQQTNNGQTTNSTSPKDDSSLLYCNESTLSIQNEDDIEKQWNAELGDDNAIEVVWSAFERNEGKANEQSKDGRTSLKEFDDA